MRLTFDDMHPHMPWDAIDAVVFDVGRVLLSFSPADILKEYLPDCPELHPRLLTKVFNSPYWVMQDRGGVTTEEVIRATTIGAPELVPAVEHLMASWVEMKEVIPEGINALRKCKAMGKKVYILSNYGNDAFRHVEEKYDFFVECDARFVSSRLHMVKPDLGIYAHVTAQTGHQPDRVLFIDDSPANIEAALEYGWQGICYNEPGKLAKFFA